MFDILMNSLSKTDTFVMYYTNRIHRNYKKRTKSRKAGRIILYSLISVENSTTKKKLNCWSLFSCWDYHWINDLMIWSLPVNINQFWVMYEKSERQSWWIRKIIHIDCYVLKQFDLINNHWNTYPSVHRLKRTFTHTALDLIPHFPFLIEQMRNRIIPWKCAMIWRCINKMKMIWRSFSLN